MGFVNMYVGFKYKLYNISKKTQIFQHEIHAVDMPSALQLAKTADYLCCYEVVEIVKAWIRNHLTRDNVTEVEQFCHDYNFPDMQESCARIRIWKAKII